MPELPKAYIAKDHESKIYDLWTKHHAFKPSGSGKPFSILMPPPNANESLHLGHALMVTAEDIMIRFARMSGKKTAWIPGTDHAGFETQVVFEKKLQKEGKSRFDFTSDELRDAIRAYVKEQQKTILSQIPMLGASCDWDRLYFTLDDNIVATVYDIFARMYRDDLLYRAKRLVNYCTKHGTSFADLEVEYEDRDTELVYIKYPIAGTDECITVATTRPETMLGDTAVAVNPKDKRYLKLIGKKAIVPLVNREIPIVGDAVIDQSFGTGAVKVTPAHSHVDAEIGQRHKLPAIEVIDTRGKMTGDIPADLNGLKVSQARAEIVASLHELNLIEKAVTHHTRIGVCYKCRTPIEILPLEQWWVKTKPLAEKALSALAKNQITITPKEAKGTLVKWLENIIDWNISRQIVWGIPIPAWFKNSDIKIQEQSPGEGWIKDTDTFDTWFSSTQLPYAALGYPEGPDFATFYPGSVMETAADILFWWVARMIMMGLYATGEVPFTHIYLHGYITDQKGQKMSKSKGNVINPLDLMEQYGTDALRWSVIHGSSPGQNFFLSTDRVVGGRNLANKLWNASRFVIGSLENSSQDSAFPHPNPLPKGEGTKTKASLATPSPEGKGRGERYSSALSNPVNTQIVKDLDKLVAEITRCFNSDQYGLATDLLHDFFWHQFCDTYLEQAKKLLEEGKATVETKSTLLHVLTTTLKLFHPFMPFVTETIWQELHERNLVSEMLLITAPWPSGQH